MLVPNILDRAHVITCVLYKTSSFEIGSSPIGKLLT